MSSGCFFNREKNVRGPLFDKVRDAVTRGPLI